MRPTAGADKNGLAQCARIAGQCLAVECRRRARHAGVAGDRAHGGRRVAGEHLQLDALGGKERDRLGRVGAQALGEHHQTERPHVVGKLRLGAGGGQRRLAAPERQHPSPGAPLLSARARRAGSALGEPLRRPQHEPLVAQVERAPATPRGERHLSDDATSRHNLREPGVRDRLERQVARRRARSVARERTSE